MKKLNQWVLAAVVSGLCNSVVAENSNASKECLLKAMEQAAEDVTIGQLRKQCKAAASSESDIEVEPVFSASGQTAEDSLDQRLKFESVTEASSFGITAHRPNYILPVTYSNDLGSENWQQSFPNSQPRELEVMFQLSFKARIIKGIMGADLWGAYTQRSWWQLYNDDRSAPFRETNYEPEVFLRWDTDYQFLGMNNRLWRFGFNHQSNGRGNLLSRSWNRLVLGTELDKGNLVLAGNVWWRLPEDEEEDDNPDILEYAGYGSFSGLYKWDSQLFKLTLKNNFRSDNKGSVQLDWTFPVGNRFRGYVQFFNGYGESLIDHDESINRIGVGFMLNDWL